jgi:hypothetical protein
MKKDFITLLDELIEYNGKKILEQPDRFLGTFLDFTQNEYRAEAQVFSQFLASKQAKEIKASDDVDVAFLGAIAERFHQASLIDKGYCELIVNAYANVLGLNEKKPKSKSEAVETPTEKAVNTPEVKASKPLLKNTKFRLIAIVGIVVIAAAIGIGIGYSRNKQVNNTNSFTFDRDASYALGMYIASQFQIYEAHYDYQALREGFKAYTEMLETRFSIDEAMSKINDAFESYENWYSR